MGFITQFGVDANNNVTSIIDANAQAALQPKTTTAKLSRAGTTNATAWPRKL